MNNNNMRNKKNFSVVINILYYYLFLFSLLLSNNRYNAMILRGAEGLRRQQRYSCPTNYHRGGYYRPSSSKVMIGKQGRRRRNPFASSYFLETTTKRTTIVLNLLGTDEAAETILMTESSTNGQLPIIIITVIALILGTSAQGWINSMLEGDQGLGAYLRDGSGYGKSGFRPKNVQKEDDDPLPWLKLPRLDFVDVAGQSEVVENNSDNRDDAMLMERLETIRIQMTQSYQRGNSVQAESLRKELEQLMKENGIEYKAD